MRPLARVALAAALTFATAAQAAPVPTDHNTLIYKVDSASAQVTGRKLTITAAGAVSTGGWHNAQLRIDPQHGPETDTLIVEFVGTPPPSGAAVIQALLPISTTVTVNLPRYPVNKVKLVAETNSLIAAVTNTP